MNLTRFRMTLLLAVLALSLLGGCGGNDGSVASDAEVAAATPPGVPAGAGVPQAAPTSAQVSTEPAVEVDPVSQPTPRTGLHATDPGSVALAAGRPQLVEFFAFWCPTCQALAPTVNALEADYHGRVAFTHLDIDDPATAPFREQLGYRVQPHIFLLGPDGEVLEEWRGPVQRDALAEAFDDALGAAQPSP